MGVKNEQFDVPVCNSFRPKIVKDQLCYQVEADEYKHFMDENIELSTELYINYNEDRQFSSSDMKDQEVPKILIETIGKYKK